MTQLDGVAHKAHLRSYFDGLGFERWSAIYGEVPLSRIRQTVRVGHAQMLQQAQNWLSDTHTSGSLVDVGCGTGLFSVAMAKQGFDVTALDIAPKMVAAAQAAAVRAGVNDHLHALEGDVNHLAKHYDVVACFDVLVHYPQAPLVEMLTGLADHCDGTLLLTYAPYNRFLAYLHWLGGRFPRSQRRTEIQMTPDQVVNEALSGAGMKVIRAMNIHHGFYHVRLLEARRV